MKRLLNISTLVALLFGLVALGSCTNDLDDNITPNGNGSSDFIVLDFDAPQKDIIIQTRAQNLDDQNENRVRNMYVFIFTAEGKKIYAQYFDSSNLVTNVDTKEDDCWQVTNTDNVSSKRTQGRVKIRTTSSANANYKIYAITNLDSSFVDISSDRLSQIQTEEELLRTKGRMLQQSVSRSGYLQMSGKMENVRINSDGAISHATDATLHLYHMDAKVQVTLTQGPAVMSLSNARIQIVNLPKVGYVWSKYAANDALSTGVDEITSMDELFNSAEMGFDDISQSTSGGVTTTTCKAWFYMLESRQTPKKQIPMACPDSDWEAYDPEKTNYNPYFERARQTKGTSSLSSGYGHNEVDADGNRNFMYANNLSPYMIIKCSIAMELTGEEAGQELGGDVAYIIPLGDAGSSAEPAAAKVNNYNTNRNTFYHYNVTVNGVHNIRVEVDARATDITDNNFQYEENQPGASGKVVVAKEEIAICDCHYESRTLTFHAKNVAQNLTWSVNTPFGEGGPQIDIEGNDVIPPGLDYEWIHFRVNKKSNGYYTINRQKYDPAEVMNVSELVKYIKEQHKLYLTEDPALPGTWVSDFDDGRMVDVNDIDGDGNTTEVVNDPEGRKICITAFIDEFYYDYNPLNPMEPIPANFWKKYVNYPSDRYMYILSESNLSRDEESRSTGSVVTIQQHPIQSIFNLDPTIDFDTAWGLEITDEDEGKLNTNGYWSTTSSDPRGNTDLYNGRLNTIKEWELFTSNTRFKDDVKWATYLDEEIPNNMPQLKSGYKYMRYSCMNRNRDNDGNGVIDQDEIRWYMAALQQLTGIAVGRDVLLPESRLYKRTSEDKRSDDPNRWRQHIVSSTTTSNSNNPVVLWGEEITSTSTFTESKSWGDDKAGSYADKGFSAWSVRCVRNLGTKNETLATGYDLSEIPDDYIEVKATGEYASSPQITCVRINPQALRAQQNTELVFGDENGEQARLSKRFYIAPNVLSLPSVSGYNLGHAYLNHNQWVEDVGSSVDTKHCPEGYRIPNLLEMTIMFNYDEINSFVSNKYFCRNYYSFGMMGEFAKDYEDHKVGWIVRKGNYGGNSDAIALIDTGDNSVNGVRCVRDASVDELAAEGLL